MPDAAPNEADQANARSLETAQDRRSEFVPVGPGGETSSAEALLISAYIVMWALIFGFLLASQRRQKKLDVRLAELEAVLAKLDRSGGLTGPGQGGSGVNASGLAGSDLGSSRAAGSGEASV